MFFFILTLTFLFSQKTFAITVETKSLAPKFFYITKKEPKFIKARFITFKANDYIVLTEKFKTHNDRIYWKTKKIRIKNESAVSKWPLEIQELIKKIRQKSTPVPPWLRIRAFASPISFSILNNARSIYTGLYANTIKSETHELSFDLTVNESYQKDERFNAETSSMVINSNLVYDYNNFVNNWTYFALISYRNQKFNGDYPIKNQYSLGLTGLKYRILNKKTEKSFIKMDISYIPIFEYLDSDFNVAYPGEKESKNQSYLRNSFRYRFILNYDQWNLNYSINYRPAYYYKIGILDMQDIDLASNLTISRSLTERIEFSFTNLYTKDIRLYRSSGMRPDNTTNSFSINMNLQI